jgi:hypothetical protein
VTRLRAGSGTIRIVIRVAMASRAAQQDRRLTKGLTERFFVLRMEAAAKHVTIKLSGSTLKVYTLVVTPNMRISCDCPDTCGHARRFRVVCKHCAFVMARVVRLLDGDLGHYLQHHQFWLHTPAYERLRALADGRAFVPQGVTDADLSTRFERASAPASLETFEEEGAECIICFRDLERGAEIEKCSTCRNVFDKGCIDRWLAYNQSCPLCRGRWVKQETSSSSKYIQL